MELRSESGYKSRNQNHIEIEENTMASRSSPSTRLRDVLMSNNPDLSYADFHHEITRNAEHISGMQQSQGAKGKAKEDEMVVYVPKSPSYLEKGKSLQEKPLNVGVLDWRYMEKRCNPTPTRNSGCSSTSTTSYFSTNESSSHSSRGNSSSPGRQRMQHYSSQSHLEASPVKKYSQDKFYSGRGRSCSPARQRTYNLYPQSHPKAYPLEGQSRHVISLPGNAASIPNLVIRQQKLCGLDQTHGANHSGIGLEKFDREVSDSSATSELGKQQTVGNLDLASSCIGKLRMRESELKKEMMPLQEPNLGDSDPDCSKEHRKLVLSPRDPPQHSRISHLPDSSSSVNKVKKGRRSFFHKDNVKELHCSDLFSGVPYSCPLPSRDESNGQSCSMTAQGVKIASQQFESPLKSRHPVDQKLIMGLKSANAIKLSAESDKRSCSEYTSKVRHPSPIRRLSSAVGSIIRSAGSRDNSPLRRSSSKDASVKVGLARAAASTSSDESLTDKSQANSRARSSPLRRLLDPLIKSKAPNVHDAAQASNKDSSSTFGRRKSSEEHSHLTKEHPAVVKSTYGSGRTKPAKDSLQNLKQGSLPFQALLQVAVKNGLPLFTFAVDNDTDILAATLSKLSAPDKLCSSWIYTFFTVQEIKRKSGLWLNHGNKGNGHNFVPNVIAQMKVSNSQFPANTRQNADGDKLREFTLFSVDTGQVDQHATEFQPTNELAAIVVKLLEATSGSSSDKPVDPSHASSRECSLETSTHSIRSHSLLNTTVILPGGVHTIPVKGSISTLTQRWRLGGSCDCGGWDVGCQLRIFTNQGESEKSSNSSKTTNAWDEFKLFSRLGQENQLVLSLNPFKDRIYSVEFDSSISLLQAFATCVAVIDCRRPSGLFSTSNVVEGRTSTAVMEGPAGHISCPPPHSPFGRV